METHNCISNRQYVGPVISPSLSLLLKETNQDDPDINEDGNGYVYYKEKLVADGFDNDMTELARIKLRCQHLEDLSLKPSIKTQQDRWLWFCYVGLSSPYLKLLERMDSYWIHERGTSIVLLDNGLSVVFFQQGNRIIYQTAELLVKEISSYQTGTIEERLAMSGFYKPGSKRDIQESMNGVILINIIRKQIKESDITSLLLSLF